MNRPGKHRGRPGGPEDRRRPPAKPALPLSFLHVHPSRVDPDHAPLTLGSPLFGLVYLGPLPVEDPVQPYYEPPFTTT